MAEKVMILMKPSACLFVVMIFVGFFPKGELEL